jgi:transposase
MQTPTVDLFTLALNLVNQWQCVSVDFDKDASRLDIVIDFQRGSTFPCPSCGKAGNPVHDTIEKDWRHLNFFEHVCYLHARVPRTRCDTCGVLLVTVPWARSGSGFTLLYEALVLALVPQMSVMGVARQMRIHDTQLWRVVHHYVGEARERVEFHAVRSLTVDETSARKGHRYVTVFADPVEKRVLYATEGKDKKTVGRFVNDFHTHNGDPDAIREVCMDMSPAFIEGVREALPNAKLTFDRFHVMQLASKAMDEVRRRETPSDALLKGSRYLWLYRPENLSARKQTLLEGHLSRNERMAKAYELVLDLRTFYEVEKTSAEILRGALYN